MIKSFTFKIKFCECKGASNSTPDVLTAIHCPLEVFYSSFKKTTEIAEFYESIKDNEAASFFVTASDYLTDDGVYIHSDHYFTTVKAMVESSSIFDLMKNEATLGFLEGDKKDEED